MLLLRTCLCKLFLTVHCPLLIKSIISELDKYIGSWTAGCLQALDALSLEWSRKLEHQELTASTKQRDMISMIEQVGRLAIPQCCSAQGSHSSLVLKLNLGSLVVISFNTISVYGGSGNSRSMDTCIFPRQMLLIVYVNIFVFFEFEQDQ